MAFIPYNNNWSNGTRILVQEFGQQERALTIPKETKVLRITYELLFSPFEPHKTDTTPGTLGCYHKIRETSTREIYADHRTALAMQIPKIAAKFKKVVRDLQGAMDLRELTVTATLSVEADGLPLLDGATIKPISIRYLPPAGEE